MPAPSRLHPAHAIGDREPVAPDHAHLHRREPLGSVAAEFCLGLVARRPSAAGIAAHRTAHRAKRLVQRNAKRLGLGVPYRDIDAGDRLHDHAPAPAFISLRDAALECRFAARAVVHLLVDTLGKHRVLADAFRRELVLHDGRDDRRRAESRTDAGEPIVGLDTDQRRVALDLCSEVGAVTVLHRNRCGHWNGGYADDLHGMVPLPELNRGRRDCYLASRNAG